MPVHPQVQQFLDQMAAQEAPPITEQTPDFARAAYLALMELLGEGEPAKVTERTAPGSGGEIPIRVYQPRNSGSRGILVYYHGGGWVIGDLDTHDHVCRALCTGAGCTVASVHYRRAPEHKFPAAVEDSWAALSWVATHAAELGGDSPRIAVGGDSAGGNLAAVMCLLARDADAPRLASQLLIYPAVDMSLGHPSIEENGDGYILTRDHMTWFRDHYLRSAADRLDPRASPLLADSHADLPPALIITAEFDPLRDEGAEYHEKLHAAGVATQLSCYDGMVHVFFQLAPLLDGGRQAVEEACAELRRRLG